MFLAIRMVLFFLFAGTAAQGVAIFDPAAGTLTFDIENLTAVIIGVSGYGGTFLSSRWAKARGGLT